ncbi:MAG TPA: DUF4912 domain-containing protein [Nitrospirales bacterium]
MTSHLPDHYGRTELVLMVVDPFHLFAYWEVMPESLRQVQDILGGEMAGGRAVLRIYDISLIHFDGNNAHFIFDIDINLETRNWYVPVWTSEKSYCADLGFVARTGRFHALARSNVVHTPRAGVSNRTEGPWMRVRFVRRRKPDRARRLELVPAPKIPGRLSSKKRRALLERQTREQARLAAQFMQGTSPTSPMPGPR